ncbi:hypothetical protein PANI_CDS0089 [Maribacter phage Panino]
MIRKISFGVDYKNAMHYQVGQSFGNVEIDTIRQQAPNEFEIYVIDNDGTVVLWKKLQNMPVVVEYDIKAFS